MLSWPELKGQTSCLYSGDLRYSSCTSESAFSPRPEARDSSKTQSPCGDGPVRWCGETLQWKERVALLCNGATKTAACMPAGISFGQCSATLRPAGARETFRTVLFMVAGVLFVESSWGHDPGTKRSSQTVQLCLDMKWLCLQTLNA